jgi:cell division septum initiation protein DivIVA
MDILRILDDLQEMIDRPRTILGMTFGLDKDEVTMQIAKVRASLPQELKQAAVTVRESDRIVETAREDATMTLEASRKEAERILQEARTESERILEQAKLQQERLVAESEVLKLSKSQAEEVRNSAERESVQMRRGAEKYAFDVLVQLETVVGKVMTTIDRGKAEMSRSDHAPTQAVVPSRERTRV